MNLQALKDEFDAHLASMSEAELMASLIEVGCVFDEPWLVSVLETDVQSILGVGVAANSNELALAA